MCLNDDKLGLYGKASECNIKHRSYVLNIYLLSFTLTSLILTFHKQFSYICLCQYTGRDLELLQNIQIKLNIPNSVNAIVQGGNPITYLKLEKW